jgi:hypothetical protein
MVAWYLAVVSGLAEGVPTERAAGGLAVYVQWLAGSAAGDAETDGEADADGVADAAEAGLLLPADRK